MKFPIRLVPCSVPPKFEYYQMVAAPGGAQMLKHVSCVPPSMEGALVDLLNIANQLAAENERLSKKTPAGVPAAVRS